MKKKDFLNDIIRELQLIEKSCEEMLTNSIRDDIGFIVTSEAKKEARLRIEIVIVLTRVFKNIIRKDNNI